jgi:high-affinity iron transporter
MPISPRILVSATALSFALSTAACGGGSQTTEATPAPPPEAATPEPTPEPTPEATPAAVAAAGEISPTLAAFLATVSAADKAKTNPLSGKADAIEKGKEEFMATCFPCHGATGKGDGPAAKALAGTGPAPADLSDPAMNGKISDGERFAVMKQGVPGTAMQAFGAALSDEQIWRLLAYVETLRSAAPAAGGGAGTQ